MVTADPKFLWCLFLFLWDFMRLSEQSTDDLMILNPGQRLALDKFRNRVEPILPQEYMREDMYLVKWLQVNKFNIPSAEKMLIENLRWRKEMDMDNILHEDWSEFEDQCRVYVEGCDRSGRPVFSTIIGEWDMRRVIVSGKARKMMRYLDKLMEEESQLLRQLNATQAIEIYDMGGYNSMQHGCLQCMGIHNYGVQSYEKHFPLMMKKTIIINASTSSTAIAQILRPFQYYQKVVYSKDRGDWTKGLRKEVSGDNLSRHFGGHNEDSWTLNEITSDFNLYKCKP